ncbi:MAG: NAD-dependent epimerase/dehydratase family protein [Fimbriimonadales bacterium]
MAGGTGQVGTLLGRAFASDGHNVVVLGRRPDAAEWRVVNWDGTTLGDWANEVEGSDVVINPAGRIGAGFSFEFPQWPDAAHVTCAKEAANGSKLSGTTGHRRLLEGFDNDKGGPMSGRRPVKRLRRA